MQSGCLLHTLPLPSQRSTLVVIFCCNISHLQTTSVFCILPLPLLHCENSQIGYFCCAQFKENTIMILCTATSIQFQFPCFQNFICSFIRAIVKIAMLVYLVVPSCGYVVQYEFEVLTPAFSLCFVGDFYLLPILFVVPHFEWSLTFLAPICFKDSILPVTFEVDHSSVASFYHFSCAVLHVYVVWLYFRLGTVYLSSRGGIQSILPLKLVP